MAIKRSRGNTGKPVKKYQEEERQQTKKESVASVEDDLNVDDDVESEGDDESAEELALDDLSDDDSEIDDEISGEEDSDSDEDDDDDENIPKLKKKKNTDDGSESFSKALTAIIGSKLKAYDRKDPILARSKKTMKKLESDKLEEKAKRALSADKKTLTEKGRVKDLLTDESRDITQSVGKERRLKKVAQRGVVRLFNAVLSTQVKTHQEISKEKILGQGKKQELITELSKEKFLDLVSAAGQS